MLQHVTLHLARGKQFPEGSSRYGYEIVAPLDEQGYLDQEEWAAKRASCRVRRFQAGEGDRHGFLVHRPGGTGGATWMIDYDRDRFGDEETGYHLHQHRFLNGDYVTIRDYGDIPHTFRVVSRSQSGSSAEEARR